MRGRCTKFRLIDIRYAGDTLHHEDMPFHFCIKNEETDLLTEAAHAMIELKNGGGKGLILQLFTNLFDPLVSWKEDKNKIEHLFYNQKGKPIKYTAYAVGEFDVGKNKRLMLGIGITPKLINREQQREEKSDIRCEYLLFAKEYEQSDSFDIFSLPLWDKEKKESISLEAWEKSIETNYK